MNDKEMDTISTIAFTNLYTISKDTQRIELVGFKWSNPEHKALLQLAKNVYTVFGFNIYIDMPFIKYLLFKIIHRKDKGIKRLTIPLNIFTPSCDEFIKHITDANNCQDIFKKIYERYYH